MERRDRVLAQYAAYLDELNRSDAERGAAARLASPARRLRDRRRRVELASRQIAPVSPADIRELEPVIERLGAG
jgi:hypothetical protein